MTLYHARPQDGAVWITGASVGLGKEVAQRLADQGYTVYASARSTAALEQLQNDYKGSGRIVALPLDVTDRAANDAAIARIVEETGGLALAILNAGNFFPARAFRLDHETFEKTIDINVSGVLNGMLPAIAAMQAAGRGQIAIVSSSAGYGGLPKSAAYGLSKAGIINMAESLKFDLDTMNIRMQVVTPGFVDTPLTKKNDYPMPFLMPADKAADAFVKGLSSSAFDITFPRRFTYMLKLVSLLPYRLYFPLVARVTGAGRKRP